VTPPSKVVLPADGRCSEPVKANETSSQDFFCASLSMVGLLISVPRHEIGVRRSRMSRPAWNLGDGPEQLIQENVFLRVAVAELAELRSRLKMSSRNSSKPPPSDGYAKPAPKSKPITKSEPLGSCPQRRAEGWRLVTASLPAPQITPGSETPPYSRRSGDGPVFPPLRLR